jgi:multidrug efflux pump
MNSLIEFMFVKFKSTFLLFLSLLIIGILSYITIPKESEPNIDFGYINISVYSDSISPEDAEKLIVKPIENELKQVKNIDEINSTSRDSMANIGVKLNFGTNIDQAINEVQNAVSRAKSKFPEDTQEPIIKEWSMANSKPVIDVILTGDINFRTLNYTAKEVKNELEKLPEILSIDLYGNREEEIEIIISPMDMETYDINHNDLINLFNLNNKMVAAGSLDNGKGKLNFKIPGTIENLDDILNMPLKKGLDKIILFKDIAKVQRSFIDPKNFSRFNNEKSITLSIKKRNGKNIIETIAKIKHVVGEAEKLVGENIKFSFANDQSGQIKIMLQDLENNIISSVFLVFLIILAALGFRTSVLVGLSIPSSFFLGVLILHFCGITMNMVVLFSLIMSIGMLVDGAIVVTEYAEKNIEKGMRSKQAYLDAAKKMFTPIFSSTLTTIVAFAPLLKWPSMTGQFMHYLPLTLITLLSCSLLVSIVFIPTIGYMFVKDKKIKKVKSKNSKAQYYYKKLLLLTIDNPKKTIATLFLTCVISFTLFINFNAGSEFFPEVDSEYTTVEIKLDGDLSVYEKDYLVKEVEDKIASLEKYFKIINAKTIDGNDGVIGILSINLIDWKKRMPSVEFNSLIRDMFKDYEGVILKVKSQQGGPQSANDLEIDFSATSREELKEVVNSVTRKFNKFEYLIDLENNIPNSGIQFNINVNREKATQYGTSIVAISPYIQMITNGLKISEYTAEDLDEEIDIRVKFEDQYRTFDTFKMLKIETPSGKIPLSYLVDVDISPKTSELYKVDKRATFGIVANVKDGYLLNEKIYDIESVLNSSVDNTSVKWKYKGDQEEQKETMVFLITAFLISLFGMFFVLLYQFNSVYQSSIVLVSIFLSISGVLLMFFILQEPFGIVMGGLGIIALSGIVINNNIVLIDSFNEKIKNGIEQKEAIFQTGVERFRPVFLTTITTVLGLLPMAFKLNIDLANGLLTYNSPSSQWWFQLAYTIIGGLLFATILTLITTPSFLMLKKTKYKNNELLN